MKIKDIRHELLYNCDRLTLVFDIKDRMEIIGKLEALGTIDDNAEYEVTIKRKREHRSKDANAYMWILADKVADVIGSTKEEVYRSAIRRKGVFTDVAVRTDAVRAIVKNWSDKGIGWFAESFDSSLKGCRRVRLYYGSSVYNTKEMSRLIDDIVEEAKGLNIETLTPDELARMKSTWRGDVA